MSESAGEQVASQGQEPPAAAGHHATTCVFPTSQRVSERRPIHFTMEHFPKKTICSKGRPAVMRWNRGRLVRNGSHPPSAVNLLSQGKQARVVLRSIEPYNNLRNILLRKESHINSWSVLIRAVQRRLSGRSTDVPCGFELRHGTKRPTQLPRSRRSLRPHIGSGMEWVHIPEDTAHHGPWLMASETPAVEALQEAMRR